MQFYSMNVISFVSAKLQLCMMSHDVILLPSDQTIVPLSYTAYGYMIRAFIMKGRDKGWSHMRQHSVISRQG